MTSSHPQFDWKRLYRLDCQISSFRKKRNWTPKKLSAISGLPYNSVWRMERGDVPKLADAYKVACAFDTTVYELWSVPVSNQVVRHAGTKALTLRELREERGWSQVEFSQMCGIDEFWISLFERGKMPTLEMAFRLAHVFGVSVYQLWTPS